MRSRPGLLVLTLFLLTLLTAPADARAVRYDVVPHGVWPLRPPDVVRTFDPPSSAWGAGHRGVDLRGRPGQPVRSALAGRVSFVGRIAGRGVVVVDHGDTRTTYQPVAEAPPVGTAVAAGDRIGRLVSVGSHCWPGACLHWGWIRGEVYLDPLLLVGAGPVRLLPLSGLGPSSPLPVVRPRSWPSVPPTGGGAASGARVGLLVGLAEAVGGHVRVQLGGRE